MSSHFSTDARSDALGQRSIDAIRASIERTLTASKALPLPGEGDERAFRNWLVTTFLKPVMGWPENQIRIGEVFDVLLLDENDKEAVTIETKPPTHKATTKDRQDFRNRLPRLPRLRAAFFTNGIMWERLDLVSADGVQDILAELSLDIQSSSVDEVESFFAPLRGDRYFPWGDRNRSLVTRSQPSIQRELARDLDAIVAELSDVFLQVLGRFERGDAGPAIQTLTRAIFDDWCSRSLETPIRKVMETIEPLLAVIQTNRTTITSALRDLAFSPQMAEGLADRVLALGLDERANLELLRHAILQSYHPHFLKLAAQSAHIVLARALVYRIGEDMNLFAPLLGSSTMEEALRRSKTIAPEPFPALALLETARRRMVPILPLLYQLSDLDWWVVPEEKESLIHGAHSSLLARCREDIEQVSVSMLRALDGFHFSQVDADVWRNVYENYLPGEERQKLGGFYTPELLVEFILDLAGYVSSSESLCKKSVLDPASGSGAFVSIAAARLIEHLSTAMPCHSSELATSRSDPAWKRDKAILDIVLRNIHAVDIHPFAAFLTTVNLTFLLLPHYARVREGNPTFSLDLQVFSADSLEKPDDQSLTKDMFEQLNSRIQLTAESAQRYLQLQVTRFDLLIGNPPWGGVLKGPLAPVYDETKKRRFIREYPNSAVGKFDVYGLFMERAGQLLAADGRFAMVTQDTYLDKTWAANLRAFLAEHCDVQYIVSLNPFGQLFFKAMNTPAVTIFDARPPQQGTFVATATSKATLPKGNPHQRQEFVLDAVKRSLDRVPDRSDRSVSVDCATSFRKSRRSLVDQALAGWDLGPPRRGRSFKGRTVRISDLYEDHQGVTPGGTLDLFLLTEQKCKELQLEPELLHRAIKSRQTSRWQASWQDLQMLYPYAPSASGFEPAFTVKGQAISDSLDFDVLLDARERQIRHSNASSEILELLEHRIATGLIAYPNIARYLVRNYQRLESRVFEKKRFTDHGRRWYEFWRPREADLMLSSPRLLTPSLVTDVRFSLDQTGLMSDHACLFLLPTDRTSGARLTLMEHLSERTRKEVSDLDLMMYCLAFLNSSMAQEILQRRRPTPKGYYAVSGHFIDELLIPVLEDALAIENLLEIVRILTNNGLTTAEIALHEARLTRLVESHIK